MNRHEARCYLHGRHRGLVDACEEGVPLEVFHMDIFVLQHRACELMEDRSERGVKRYFVSMEHLLGAGDPEVIEAVADHFMHPQLILHPELPWARERMPPFLARLCDLLRAEIEEEEKEFPRGWESRD